MDEKVVTANIQEHQEDQEEAEEALSLSNFPLQTNEEEEEEGIRNTPKLQQDPRSSSDLFEFFSDLTAEMSHAEDIFFCGKLVPLNHHHHHKQQQPPQIPSKNTIEYQQRHISHSKPPTPTRNEKLKSFRSRRSESLPDLAACSRSSSGGHTKTQLMRNSRSLDYQKLSRNYSTSSETTAEIRRNSSVKSDVSATKTPRPRWYIMMFGMVKFPAEMDLQDIKTRQIRRSSSTLFPSPDSNTKKALVAHTNYRKSSWNVLKVLSCKDHASVAVKDQFACA